MRKMFVKTLLKYMKKNERIYLLTGDLGWGVLDPIKNEFGKKSTFGKPRFINCGISEQLMIGLAVGLATCNKTPFCYSITPFLLYRPFEFIRNDIDHDKANVKLIACGRDKDYGRQGFTHWCEDEQKIMKLFKNIKYYRPRSKERIPQIVKEMIEIDRPCYLSLSRF